MYVEYLFQGHLKHLREDKPVFFKLIQLFTGSYNVPTLIETRSFLPYSELDSIGSSTIPGHFQKKKTNLFFAEL